jgi:hypothetical protein
LCERCRGATNVAVASARVTRPFSLCSPSRLLINIELSAAGVPTRAGAQPTDLPTIRSALEVQVHLTLSEETPGRAGAIPSNSRACVIWQARWNYDCRPITRCTSASALSQAIRSLIPSASRARARAATAVSIGSQMSTSVSSAAAIELGVG